MRGLGCAVEDIDGNVFLDFAAGIAVNSTGHSHPDVVAAIKRQADELQHFSASDFYLPIYAQAAAELARIAPMTGPTRVFIGNSGAEAVEAGLKLARYHTRRQNVIAFLGGLPRPDDGRRSASRRPRRSTTPTSGRCSPASTTCPFGNEGLEEIEQRVFKRLMPADEFAAVIVEPIQGEGGYVVPEDDFLARLRELCDRHGILLIADEVQSGAGRTGKMWAIQHWDVEPDILLTAKGIGSGMPVGAMVARADVMSWGPGAHGSTYGGNPVALAALLETIRLLEGGLIANAGIRGREVMDGLRPLVDQFPGLVRDVRGKGLMIGIQFDSGETADAVQMQAFDRGLLVLEAGDDCVRMSPPLVVTQSEVATAVRIFTERSPTSRPTGARTSPSARRPHAPVSPPRDSAPRGDRARGRRGHYTRAALNRRGAEGHARQGRLDARRDRGPRPGRGHRRDRGVHPPHRLLGRPRDHPPAPARPHPRADDAGPHLRPDDRGRRRPQAHLLAGSATRASAASTRSAAGSSPRRWGRAPRSSSRSTATSAWSPATRRAPPTCRSCRCAPTSRPTCRRRTR